MTLTGGGLKPKRNHRFLLSNFLSGAYLTQIETQESL